MSGQECENCPLCKENFDEEDLSFRPCQCGYHICMFCWHQIKSEKEGGLCPSCKTPYEEEPVQYVPLNMSELEQRREEEKLQKQKLKEEKKIEQEQLSLAETKIVQRNVMFVTGLPSDMNDIEALKKPECFGKFGEIKRVSLNKMPAHNNGNANHQSARVEFCRMEDALEAIKALNAGKSQFGNGVKAGLSTTRYCEQFIKKLPCTKRFCVFSHEFADKEVCFSKDDMAKKKHVQYENMLISKYCKKEAPVKPPVGRSNVQNVDKETNVVSAKTGKAEKQTQSKASKKRQAKKNKNNAN